MRVLPSLFALVSLGSALVGCERQLYEHYTEAPMQTELRLTPGRNLLHLQANIEPHWPAPPDTSEGQWRIHDHLSASATLRWINLGPDPAPSVVELRATVPGLPEPAQPITQVLRPNRDGSASLYTNFDFDRCTTPCRVDLELAWHHAPSGELRVDWNISATRNASRARPSGSYNWNYRVVPVETTTGTLALAPATSPDTRPTIAE